jgi:hypothetical protein
MYAPQFAPIGRLVWRVHKKQYMRHPSTPKKVTDSERKKTGPALDGRRGPRPGSILRSLYPVAQDPFIMVRFRQWQPIPAFAGMTTLTERAPNDVIPAKARIRCPDAC